MKRPNSKDFRLFARLSDVDGDLISDCEIPAAESPAPPTRGRILRSRLARPQAVWAAVITVVLISAVASLLLTAILHRPDAPPSADTPPYETDEVRPTHAMAASLKKGMTVADMLALMGDVYTLQDGRYTFTLQNGEMLAVDTQAADGGEATVSGFAWLGDTVKTVNPTDLPADILQRMQEYATDTVIPVYAMESLFIHYQYFMTPTLDELLESAEVVYLRNSADGKSVALDAEGNVTDSAVRGLPALDGLNALFDSSVQIKDYYPILSAYEGGAVYLRTSVGEYVLYAHGGDPEADPSQLAEGLYLMPVKAFGRFAGNIVSDNGKLSDLTETAWQIDPTRLDEIAPYDIRSDAYAPPKNIATPHAADTVAAGLQMADVTDRLGQCLKCSSAHEHENPPASTMHYWELTDGSALILRNPSNTVQDVLRVENADLLDEVGRATSAICALQSAGMSESLVCGLMGTPLEKSDTESRWFWYENGLTHTATLAWSAEQADANRVLLSIDHTTISTADAVGGIQAGMLFSEIEARLGPCRDGHKEESGVIALVKNGYHFWTLSDGRCLAAYTGIDIPASTHPLGWSYSTHYSCKAMHVLLLDTADEADTLGAPSLSLARSLKAGIEEEAVIALLGQPTVSADGIVSCWTWSEGGKPYTLTVYWKENEPQGLFDHFLTVTRAELTEGESVSLPIPDGQPTPDAAATVTDGMTASQLLGIMGSRMDHSTVIGDATLYAWTLTDGRAFCALAEGDPARDERVVTYTYYRDSLEDVERCTSENASYVTVGTSLTLALSILGRPYHVTNDLMTVQWSFESGNVWYFIATVEAVTDPETGISQFVITSITYD